MESVFHVFLLLPTQIVARKEVFSFCVIAEQKRCSQILVKNNH